MERFRRKKSKASLINQGSQQVHSQKSTQILQPNSSSLGISSTKEYSLPCELDRSSSRRGSGLPIKKLLAEEMLKETEANKRSPGVVARLMGFDGLPSQQTINTQQKTSKSRTTSGTSAMRRTPYESQSNMRCSKENPKFKDVYEVSETKKYVKPNDFESEMEFIRDKFSDAKRLSSDNRFHDSKEFRDTLNALDNNKDLLIKYLQQPDCLYRKNLQDLQGDFDMYVNSCPRSISEKCENKTGYLQCNTRMSRKQLGNLSPNSYSPGSSNRSLNTFDIRSNEQHERESPHTRIVVLKPNLEKVQNAKKSASLRSRHVEYNGFSCPNMRESREKAKEITRRMRKHNGDKPIDFASIFQGYSGDESSYSVSGGESGSELEETVLSTRKSFHWNNQRNSTSSSSRESSISTEAKKRLSKRWNVSQKYRDVGSIGEVSKLGEMLGKPDKEMRREKLDPTLVPDMSRGRICVNDIVYIDNPLGINSRDNVKELNVRHASKSGFLSDSSISCYSPGRKFVPRQPDNIERNRESKENVYMVEDSSIRSQRSGNPKVRFRCKSGYAADIMEKEQFDFNVGEIITSPQESLVSKISASDAELKVELESKALFCGSPDNFHVKQSLSLSGIDSSPPGPEVPKLQIDPAEEPVQLNCQVPEIESPDGSKEADHPSLISVVKAPLTEDISPGSECFEEVSAGLHELRMQLKLLRMESSADDDNLVSSYKDDNRSSVSEIDDNEILEYATWQTSYISDTLKESGFDNIDPNMILAVWDSLETPIGLWVFDELEKKYLKEKVLLKSDRRLLFDRVNCGLSEIFWWLVDPHPWVQTERRKVGFLWAKNGTQYELEKLLLSEEDYTIEKVLDQEMEWFDLGDEIDDIGRDLENLLVNDLLDELVEEMYAV